MHEIGCSRQNYKCKVCGACVPKSERDQHEQEEHVEIECKNKCGHKALKYEFGDHEKTCRMNPKECKFCERMIPCAEADDHY